MYTFQVLGLGVRISGETVSANKYLPSCEAVNRGGVPTFASAKVKNAIGRIGIFLLAFRE